jgi:hypothetical protein
MMPKEGKRWECVTMKKSIWGTAWEIQRHTMWNRKRMRKCYLISIITLLTLEFSFLSAAQTSYPILEASEYQLKAAWLKMIAMFIEWPKSAGICDPSKPFIIGVVGESPLSREINTFYINGAQQIKKKRVILQRVSDKEDLPLCHLLFIARSAKYRLSKIIAAVESLPILTISDTEGFADRGIHINFIIRHRNLWFEVNRNTLDKSGLLASHHLLKVAKRIISRPTEEEMIERSHQ